MADLNKTESLILAKIAEYGYYQFPAGVMRASMQPYSKLYTTNVRLRRAARSLEEKGLVTVERFKGVSERGSREDYQIHTVKLAGPTTK
jgi:hypothetical protein